jgi:hypothetical protein
VFDAFCPSEDLQLDGRGLRMRLPTMLAGDQRRLRMVYRDETRAAGGRQSRELPRN